MAKARRRTGTIPCTLLALLIGAPALAAPWAPAARPLDPAAAVAAFPDSAAMWRARAGAALQAGDRAALAAAMARLDALGIALRPASYDAMTPLLGAAAVARHRATAQALAERSASHVALTMPADLLLNEGFAHDPATGATYGGSVIDGRLVRIAADGAVTDLAPGVPGLFAMAIDPVRRRLWVGAGRAGPTRAGSGDFAGLLLVDLDRGAVVRRIAAPPGVIALNDLAVGRDGSIFASDSSGGGIYQWRDGAPAILPLVAPGSLKSPQGLAPSADGTRLYIADYGRGIALLALPTGRLSRLEVAAGAGAVPLDGIDGLLSDGRGALIAIQNGLNPMRIVRLTLSADGASVSAAETLERAHGEWGEPTVGQLVDGTLLYASDPQWERWKDGGTIDGAAPLRPNRIRRLPLKAGDGR